MPLDHTPTEPQQRSFGFSKASRLLSKSEFDRVYRLRCKAGDGTLLVFAAVNGQALSRIGLSVSRKVGNAVVRNRIKRLLREAFRLQQHELPQGFDWIVIPSAPDKANLAAYANSLRELTIRLARKIARNSTAEKTSGESP